MGLPGTDKTTGEVVKADDCQVPLSLPLALKKKKNVGQRMWRVQRDF